MSDIDVPMIFAEDDYNELLRRAVAVIETSRIQIAKRLNSVVMSSLSRRICYPT